MNIKLYLSGAVSNDAHYREKFSYYEEYAGIMYPEYEIINPVKACEQAGLTEWKECMKLCLSLLLDCQMILVIRDGIRSRGVEIEMFLAQILGKKIEFVMKIDEHNGISPSAKEVDFPVEGYSLMVSHLLGLYYPNGTKITIDSQGYQMNIPSKMNILKAFYSALK